MLSGSAAARQYGYSSARAKAMQSELLSHKTIQDVMNAKDSSAILSILFQSSYKTEIEEFGGKEIKNEMIDFALSKNMAKNLIKLIGIAPTTEKKLIRAIVGRWSLYNIKLALEAKDRKQNYDSIARYVIDAGRYDAAAIKEAMREETIDGMLNKFMINSPFYKILKDAQEAYKNTKSAIEAVAAIDKSYYKELGSIIIQLRTIHPESALILKMDIDMKNLLTLIRAKRLNAKFADVEKMLIERGNISMQSLESMYTGSKDIEALVSQVKSLDLQEAVKVYNESKVKRLLTFEIAMKNSIFNNSIRLLKHSILSFGTMLAYAYMKEIEVFTIRIMVNSRLYGLSKEETARLISWKSE